MADQKQQATEAITTAAKEEGQKALEKAVKGTDAEKIVNDILGGGKSKDSTKVADSTATAPSDADVQKQLEDEAKKKIQNLLKKKKN